MTILLWTVGIIVVIIVAVVGIMVISNSRRLQRIALGEEKRPTSQDSYIYYQRWRLERMQKRKVPVREIYQYAESEISHIFASGNTETKMNWLNSWGMILNHVLKPDYTSEVWEEEGFMSLHLKVSEYAKQISPKGLDTAFRPGFDADKIIARYEAEHPNIKT